MTVMQRRLEKHNLTIKILIRFLLLSILMGSACFSYVNALVSLTLPEKTVVITVECAGNGGGSEVWLLQQNIETDAFDSCKNGVVTGIWEYRDSVEYGYSCNLLLSYGDNIGSSISFQSKSFNSILFWKIPASGIVSVEIDGKAVEYDLYSAESGFLSVSCGEENEVRETFLRLSIYAILYVLIFLALCGVYVVLQNGCKLPEWFERVYGWRSCVACTVVFYVLAVASYKIGIPNFLEFGDQLYYWQSPGFPNPFHVAAGGLSFRGYLCRYLPQVAQVCGAALRIDPPLIWFLLPCSAAGSLIGYTLPKVQELLCGRKANYLQILTMALLFFFFWNGMITAVLMDLLGVCCFLTGISFTMQFINTGRYCFCVPAGVMFAAATLFRSTYQYGVLAFSAIILFSYLFYKKNRREFFIGSHWFNRVCGKTLIIGVILEFCSLLLICFPQLYANLQVGIWSPFPYAGEWMNGFSIAELSASQTFTSGLTGYPFTVTDNQISHMASNAGVNYTGVGWHLPTTFKIFSSQMMDTLIYIGKKLFCGFDVKISIPYPNFNYTHHSAFVLFSFFNYCINGTALYQIIYRRDLLSNYEKTLLGLLFVTLLLPQTFVHVEWRYFIVGYFMIYYLVVYKFSPMLKHPMVSLTKEVERYLLFLCCYVYFSQWISLTFYG